MRRELLTAMLFAVLFFTALSIRNLSRVRAHVAKMEVELADTHARARSLEAESDQLRVQLREVEMLYAVFEKADAGDHVVSSDGRIEMFTWRDPTGPLCAHWCAREDPGGPCLPSGPDRCLP